MSWQNVVDRYLPAAGGGDPSLLVGGDEDDEDDADFVPESLRGFFQAANQTLEAHTRELLEMDEAPSGAADQEEIDPEPTPSGDVLPNPFFSPEPEMSFISPGLTGANPAAELTDSQARLLALEGASPGDIVMGDAVSDRTAQKNLFKEDPIPPTQQPEQRSLTTEEQTRRPDQLQSHQPDQSTVPKKDTSRKTPNLAKPDTKAGSSKSKSKSPLSPSNKAGLFGGRKGAKVAPDSGEQSPATTKPPSNTSSTTSSRLFQATSSSSARQQQAIPKSPVQSEAESGASKQLPKGIKPTPPQTAAPAAADTPTSQANPPTPPIHRGAASSKMSTSSHLQVSPAAAQVIPSRLFQPTSSRQAQQQGESEKTMPSPPVNPTSAQVKAKKAAAHSQPSTASPSIPPSRAKPEVASSRTPPPSSRLLQGTASSASKNKRRQQELSATDPPDTSVHPTAEHLGRRDPPPLSQPPAPMETSREPLPTKDQANLGFPPTNSAVAVTGDPGSIMPPEGKLNPGASTGDVAPLPPPPATQSHTAAYGTSEESLLNALKHWGASTWTQATATTAEERKLPSPPPRPPPPPPPRPNAASTDTNTRAVPPPPPKKKLPKFMAPTASVACKTSSTLKSRKDESSPTTVDVPRRQKKLPKPPKTLNQTREAKSGTLGQPPAKKITQSSIPRIATRSRLFQGTASSEARFAKPTSKPKPSVPSSDLPSSPLPSRLLQGTEATTVRVANSPPYTKNVAAKAEASKEHVRARNEEKKRKEILEKERIRLLNLSRKKKQIENQKKVQDSLDHARERRERAEKKEQERMEKLKAKIAQKENRRSSFDLKQLHKVDLRPRPPKTKKVPPTVPVAPHFATDARAAQAPTTPGIAESNIVPALAQSDDVLRRGLRSQSPSSVSATDANRARPSLTIPEGPKFATSARHGDKVGLQKDKEEEANIHGWESHLRKIDLPTDKKRGPPKLTVPKTPKFHKTRTRELAKSTAEKEKELMEFYKTHPFKARPVRIHDVSPVVRPPPRSERRLTTPEPFTLRTDNRAQKNPDLEVDNASEPKLFRARPMPDFSGTKSIPITGRTPESEKRVTESQPFHFYTDERAAFSSPKRVATDAEKEAAAFRARPMPDFSKSSPVIHERDPTRLLKHRPGKAEQVDEEPKPFKARPMPDFKIGLVIHGSDPVKKLKPLPPKVEQQEEEAKPFKARPMPDFKTSLVSPVHDRDPAKLLKHRPLKVEPSLKIDQEKEEPKPFKARPMPNFKPSPPLKRTPPVKVRKPAAMVSPVQMSSPSTSRVEPSPNFKARPMPKFTQPQQIVSPRNPLRLRTSQGSVNNDTEKSPGFKARPVPDFSNPALPVRDRDPAKLKSPERIHRVHNTADQDRSPIWETSFTARPSPDFSRVKIPVRDRKVKATKQSTPQKDGAAPGANKGKEKVTISKSSARRRLDLGRPSAKATENGKPSTEGGASKIASQPSVDLSNEGPRPAALAIAEAKMKVVEGTARMFGEDTVRQESPQVRTPIAHNLGNGERSRDQDLQELRKATEGLGRGTLGTPAPYHSHPDYGAHLEEDEVSEHSRRMDAIRIAQEVERAAQDELSLRGHASVDAEDYIEEATDDPINTVFTFSGRRK